MFCNRLGVSMFDTAVGGRFALWLVGVATEKPSKCIMMFKCDLQGVVIASYILKQHKSILFLQDLSIDKYDMFRLLAIIP